MSAEHRTAALREAIARDQAPSFLGVDHLEPWAYWYMNHHRARVDRLNAQRPPAYVWAYFCCLECSCMWSHQVATDGQRDYFKRETCPDCGSNNWSVSVDAAI